LPRRIKEGLAHWRGVYLITDNCDGARYVGSAYGADNILGRWQSYAKSGHGGNKLLKLRDARSFSFSILQRVSPDLPAEDVIAIETSWKVRLGTRAPAGLNEN
jgi:GIY-YIG catalytic domain